MGFCWVRYLLAAAVFATYVLSIFDMHNFRNMERLHQGILTFSVIQIVLTLYISSVMKIRVSADLLRKRADGSMPLTSYVLFCYYYWVQVFIVGLGKLNVMLTGKSSKNKVTENLYIGDWFSSFDVCCDGDSCKKWAGVVDLTNDLPRLYPKVTGEYLNIPCWDGTPPSLAETDKAVQFAIARMKKGPVLVHCAFGKGRSATVVLAILIASKTCKNLEDALKLLKEKRPQISVNKMMRSQLEQWIKRGTFNKIE